MGGGTTKQVLYQVGRHGLSPRGRGNPSSSPRRSASQRSIPAWAGEPQNKFFTKSGGTVYPRVGGGTRHRLLAGQQVNGLSPRGRGNHKTSSLPSRAARSIPAWAGEPVIVSSPVSKSTVYPRVGGGTLRYPILDKLALGLSPRGRGNRALCVAPGGPQGSIPAWAGEPLNRSA